MKILIANLLILFINVAVCGLTLKMYTEYFKDQKIERRSDNDYLAGEKTEEVVE